MTCTKCGTQVDQSDKFCRECGQSLRATSSRLDAIVGDDYINVGNLDNVKGAALGSGSKAEVHDIRQQNIEAPRPTGKEISILWGVFKYATFVTTAGSIVLIALLLTNVINRDVVYAPSGPLSKLGEQIEQWFATSTPIPTEVILPVASPTLISTAPLIPTATLTTLPTVASTPTAIPLSTATSTRILNISTETYTPTGTPRNVPAEDPRLVEDFILDPTNTSTDQPLTLEPPIATAKAAIDILETSEPTNTATPFTEAKIDLVQQGDRYILNSKPDLTAITLPCGVCIELVASTSRSAVAGNPVAGLGKCDKEEIQVKRDELQVGTNYIALWEYSLGQDATCTPEYEQGKFIRRKSNVVSVNIGSGSGSSSGYPAPNSIGAD